MKNLLKNIPDNLPDEFFETLVKNDHIHIERIISKGHTPPEEGWHDQDKNEFVLLLKGAARLEFEEGRVVRLSSHTGHLSLRMDFSGGTHCF